MTDPTSDAVREAFATIDRAAEALGGELQFEVEEAAATLTAALSDLERLRGIVTAKGCDICPNNDPAFVRVPRSVLERDSAHVASNDMEAGVVYAATQYLGVFGGDQPKPTVCPTCGGRGKKMTSVLHFAGEALPMSVPCPTCHGTGVSA